MNFRQIAVRRALLVLILLTPPLQAYTDPGTGALVWQMLLGAAFGAMFYFRRLLSWFTNKKD
jgi:hypothetical protein